MHNPDGAQNVQWQSPGHIRFAALPPLALYIHLPWCVRKCPYCDFNSHVLANPTLPNPVLPNTDALYPLVSQGASPSSNAPCGAPPLALQQRYIHALVADLEAQLPKVWGRRLSSIFIGGGTPSLFDPSCIDTLLAAVRARLGQPTSGEITLEANPGTFEQARFEGYRAAGVTRLSVGVQSFDEGCLQALGRIHQGEDARQAVLSAMQLFERVNVDLMYGLPKQTVAMAKHDVQTALGLGVEHLSLYQLTLEPNTQFALQPPPLPPEDEQEAIEEAVHGLAAQAGLQRYEVSAFAKPGQRCQHNSNYWEFGDYLGIGAGAHAKLSFPNAIERQVRLRKPMAYLEAIEQGQGAHLECTPVQVDELPFEFMLNAMRLAEGVPSTWYPERCGRPLADLNRALQAATKRGLLVNNPTRLQPSPLGFRYLNDLLDLFLPRR